MTTRRKAAPLTEAENAPSSAEGGASLPITYVDRCTVNGCPAPNNPDWHIPWCGHGLAGEHHHKPKRSQGGKKIVAFLCPACHALTDTKYGDRAYPDHNGRLAYMLWANNKDGTPGKTLIHRYVDTGEVIGEGGGTKRHPSGNAVEDGASPASLSGHLESIASHQDADSGLPTADGDSLATLLPAVSECREILADLSGFDDEELATLFQHADEQQRDAFLLKCHCVHAYRERHIQAWGSSWVENAYQLFHLSRRTLFAYANVWGAATEISATGALILENVGPLTDSKGLMQFIGQKSSEDAVIAMEAAVSLLGEHGEAPTVAELQHRLGEERRDRPCVHEFEMRCRKCGANQEG